MGLLVDDMLLLARLDQDRPLGRQPVDLLSLASDAVVDARAVDPTRPIDLVVLTQDQWLDEVPVVLGDEPQLRQVTANLLSNALRHTPPGTPVHVQVGVQGESVVLAVADEGPGMSPDIAARVFERFYRSDPGRTRARGGSGLGLSIVERRRARPWGSRDLSEQPHRNDLPRHSPRRYADQGSGRECEQCVVRPDAGDGGGRCRCPFTGFSGSIRRPLTMSIERAPDRSGPTGRQRSPMSFGTAQPRASGAPPNLACCPRSSPQLVSRGVVTVTAIPERRRLRWSWRWPRPV